MPKCRRLFSFSMSWRRYAQCTDDSSGAGACLDPCREGCLLRELRDGFELGLAAMRSLRVGSNSRTGPSVLRPLRSRNPTRSVDRARASTCGLTCASAHMGTHPRPPSAMGCGLITDSRNEYREAPPTLVHRCFSIESSPIGSAHENLSAIDARKLHRHAEESIFLFLIVGGERILVQDDGRYVAFMARPGKLGELGFDDGDQIGFSLREFRLVQIWHDSAPPIGFYLFNFQTCGLLQPRAHLKAMSLSQPLHP